MTDTPYRDEVARLAQEEHASEMGRGPADREERRWLRWLRDCEVLFFGAAQRHDERGFDENEADAGYSLDGMSDLFDEGLTPAQAVARLPWRDCPACRGRGFVMATGVPYTPAVRLECSCPRRPR